MRKEISKKLLILIIGSIGLNTASASFVFAADSFVISNTVISSHNTGNQANQGSDGEDGAPGKDGRPGRDGQSIITNGRAGASINITTISPATANSDSSERNIPSVVSTTESTSTTGDKSHQTAAVFVPEAMNVEVEQSTTKDDLEKNTLTEQTISDNFASNPALLFDAIHLSLQYNPLLWQLILFEYDK